MTTYIDALKTLTEAANEANDRLEKQRKDMYECGKRLSDQKQRYSKILKDDAAGECTLTATQMAAERNKIDELENDLLYARKRATEAEKRIKDGLRPVLDKARLDHMKASKAIREEMEPILEELREIRVRQLEALFKARELYMRDEVSRAEYVKVHEYATGHTPLIHNETDITRFLRDNQREGFIGIFPEIDEFTLSFYRGVLPEWAEQYRTKSTIEQLSI
jgi:hypothetical protein